MIARRHLLQSAGVLLAKPSSSAQSSAASLAAGEPMFLLGEQILEDHWMLQRTIERPARSPANPVIRKDRPWEGMGPYLYGSVIRDDAGTWKCWYCVHDPAAYRARRPGAYRIAYATSPDGVRWSKPGLGLVPHEDNKQTNLLPIGTRNAEAIDVRSVPPGAGTSARFVGLTLDVGVHLYLSDDGLRWRAAEPLVVDPAHSDCHNSICWDGETRRWLAFIRPPVFAGPGHDKRRIAVMASSDLRSWNKPRTVLAPDEQDPPEFYSMPVFRRGNLFWGQLQIYRRDRESLEVELVYSADGERWHRLPDRPTFLGTGPANSFDSGMVTTASEPVIDGDRMRFYYGGWNGNHKSNVRDAAIGFAESLRDRLIGWRTQDSTPGFLVTRPLSLRGKRLLANAQVRGTLQMALADADGRPLPGYGFDDCVPVRGDSVRHNIQWKGSTALPANLGPVRIRVRITDGTLWALETL